MGADMLIAFALIDKDKEPDFDAGRKAVRELSIDDLVSAGEEVGIGTGPCLDGEADLLEWATGMVDALEDSWSYLAIGNDQHR